MVAKGMSIAQSIMLQNLKAVATKKAAKHATDIGSLLGYGSDEEGSSESASNEPQEDAMDSFMTEIDALEKQTIQNNIAEPAIDLTSIPEPAGNFVLPGITYTHSDSSDDSASSAEGTGPPPGLPPAPPGLTVPASSAPPGLPSTPPGLPSAKKSAPPGLGTAGAPPGLAAKKNSPKKSRSPEKKEVIQIDEQTDDFLKELDLMNEVQSPTEKPAEKKADSKQSYIEQIESVTARVNKELQKVEKSAKLDESRSRSRDRKKKTKKRKRESDSGKDDKSAKRRKTGDKPVWRQCYDEKSSKFYYWNIKTQKTTWRKPDEPFEAYKAKSSKKGKEKGEKKGKEKSEKKGKEKSEKKGKEKAEKNGKEKEKDRSSDRSRRREKDKDKKKKTRRRRSRSGSYSRKERERRSRSRDRERRRRKERSRSREKREARARVEKKPELTIAEKAKSIKTSKTFVTNTHSGLKSRIDHLQEEIKEPELLANLSQYTLILETRFEDWSANALGTEYFVTKMKELGEKVEIVAKKHGMVAEAESKAKQAEIDAKEARLKEAEEEKKPVEPPVVAATQSETTEVNMDMTDSDAENEDNNDATVSLPIPFNYIRRHDQGSQKVYYEHSKNKATTWTLSAVNSNWVDLTTLLFWDVSELKLQTTDDIEQLFESRSDIEVTKAIRTNEKYILVEYASEQDAWNALIFLNIAQKTPEMTYSLANEWLKTKFDFNVRFLNHSDKTGTFFLTFCHSAKKFDKASL